MLYLDELRLAQWKIDDWLDLPSLRSQTWNVNSRETAALLELCHYLLLGSLIMHCLIFTPALVHFFIGLAT